MSEKWMSICMMVDLKSLQITSARDSSLKAITDADEFLEKSKIDALKNTLFDNEETAGNRSNRDQEFLKWVCSVLEELPSTYVKAAGFAIDLSIVSFWGSEPKSLPKERKHPLADYIETDVGFDKLLLSAAESEIKKIGYLELYNILHPKRTFDVCSKYKNSFYKSQANGKETGQPQEWIHKCGPAFGHSVNQFWVALDDYKSYLDSLSAERGISLMFASLALSVRGTALIRMLALLILMKRLSENLNAAQEFNSIDHEKVISVLRIAFRIGDDASNELQSRLPLTHLLAKIGATIALMSLNSKPSVKKDYWVEVSGRNSPAIDPKTFSYPDTRSLLQSLKQSSRFFSKDPHTKTVFDLVVPNYIDDPYKRNFVELLANKLVIFSETGAIVTYAERASESLPISLAGSKIQGNSQRFMTIDGRLIVEELSYAVVVPSLNPLVKNPSDGWFIFSDKVDQQISLGISSRTAEALVEDLRELEMNHVAPLMPNYLLSLVYTFLGKKKFDEPIEP
jgi:hypothetical protein